MPLASLDTGHFRYLLAPLFPVHLLNLLFHNANGFVEPDRVTTHPLDFNRRKPLPGVLRWFIAGPVTLSEGDALLTPLCTVLDAVSVPLVLCPPIPVNGVYLTEQI
jgi:hypothetical protein